MYSRPAPPPYTALHIADARQSDFESWCRLSISVIFSAAQSSAVQAFHHQDAALPARSPARSMLHARRTRNFKLEKPRDIALETPSQ